MNITEANAVNTVLRWVTNQPQPGVGVPSSIGAKEAAELLAGRAYKALSAGMDARDVAEHWPGRDTGDREPRLGYATTRELLAEITARIDVDGANGGGGLDYSTVGRGHDGDGDGEDDVPGGERL